MSQQITQRKYRLKPTTVLNEMLDETTRKIIQLTMNNPLTVNEIMSSLKLPQTSIYRKIPKLVSVGLLVRRGKRDKNNRAIPTYHAISNKIEINLGIDGLKVEGV